MTETLTWVPLEDLKRPRAVVPRGSSTWFVLYGSLAPGQDPEWRRVRSDESVLIPLREYVFPDDAEGYFRFLLRAGLGALLRLPADVVSPEGLHLFVGRPLDQELDGDKRYWRMWCGLAVEQAKAPRPRNS